MSKSVEIDKLFEEDAVRVDLADKGAVVVRVENGVLTIDACNHKTMVREKVHIKLNKS